MKTKIKIPLEIDYEGESEGIIIEASFNLTQEAAKKMS